MLSTNLGAVIDEKKEKAIKDIATACGISEDYLRSKIEEAENKLEMPLYPRLRPLPPRKEKVFEVPLSPKQYGIRK